MPEIRTAEITDDDIVALHVAVLILSDKADAQATQEQRGRLLSYAARLNDLITNSTVTDRSAP